MIKLLSKGDPLKQRVFYMTNPSLYKRLLACVYELLILMAIWMLCTWLYMQCVGAADAGVARFGLQMVLWLVTGAYFVRCWVKSGQTPATQAWKIQLVNARGELLTLPQAIARYVLAGVLAMAFGLGFWWALLDKQQLFLHDRWLNTCWVAKT